MAIVDLHDLHSSQVTFDSDIFASVVDIRYKWVNLSNEKCMFLELLQVTGASWWTSASWALVRRVRTVFLSLTKTSDVYQVCSLEKVNSNTRPANSYQTYLHYLSW